MSAALDIIKYFYLWSLLASRQQMREEILATTTSHVAAFADALDAVAAQGVAAVLGSTQAVKAANDERGLFPIVLPLM